MLTPISPEVEDHRALVEAINDRLQELDAPLPAERVLVAVPGERNDSSKTVLLDLQSVLFDLIGNAKETISLDGDAIFGGDSWDEMVGGGNTTLHTHDIYGALAENEVVTGDWTFTDTLDVLSTVGGTEAELTVQSSGPGTQANLIVKGTSDTLTWYSSLQLWADMATDQTWVIAHSAIVADANRLTFSHASYPTSPAHKVYFTTAGIIGCGGINMGGYTLTSSEWANLDGIDQSLATTDTAQFAKLGINTATVPHGGVGGARLAIEGTNVSAAAGPHVQFTTNSDDYPLMQMFMWRHDNVMLLFDAYYDGAYKSSDAGSNFRIQKAADEFRIGYDSGVAAGSEVTFNRALTLDTSGNWLVGGTGQMRFNAATEYINSGAAGYMDYAAATAHRFNNEIHIGTTVIDQVDAAKTITIGTELRLGTLPVSAAYAFLGNTDLDQSGYLNYALLAKNDGSTFLNASSSKTIYFRISNVSTMDMTGTYLRIAGTKQLQFNDAGTYIYSRADSYLSLVADGGIELGDATGGDYTLIEPDGTLKAVGDATTFEDCYIGFDHVQGQHQAVHLCSQ
jgi:hypothetical protein